MTPADFDWSAPTDRMLAALALGRRCAERGGLGEIEMAEWVLTATESLWYLQAAAWADDPPAELLHDPTSRAMFARAMALVVRIVDLGYDDEVRQWWYLRRIWPSDADAAVGMLLLMDAATMLERMREIPIWPKDVPREHAQPGFLVASAGFWVFFSVVCGPRWRQRFAAMVSGSQMARRIRFTPGRRRR